MQLHELRESYLDHFLDKLSRENQTIFIVVDFNVGSMKYCYHFNISLDLYT